jgi:hypothetical protein
LPDVPHCVTDIVGFIAPSVSAVIVGARVRRDKWCLTWT